VDGMEARPEPIEWGLPFRLVEPAALGTASEFVL
jgi:hypothetical protein